MLLSFHLSYINTVIAKKLSFERSVEGGEVLELSKLPFPSVKRNVSALTVSCVTESLLKLKRTASGPDGIPYWIWKEFAYDLAPVVTHIFNCSLENHTVPDLWKLADITPLPKESNFKNCTQLGPISLTNVIMRVFERLVCRQELSQYVNNFIDLDQFAYR